MWVDLVISSRYTYIYIGDNILIYNISDKSKAQSNTSLSFMLCRNPNSFGSYNFTNFYIHFTVPHNILKHNFYTTYVVNAICIILLWNLSQSIQTENRETWKFMSAPVYCYSVFVNMTCQTGARLL